MPASIGIVILDDGGFLFNDLSSGATAGHRGAQKDVDDEHNEEQNTEGYREPQEPGWMDAAFFVREDG